MEIAYPKYKDAKELTNMKRILTLDGGGIRGVFSLEVLLHIQTLLRTQYGNPEMVLADHFDLFAGTSTGAIIATCLCWGMAVEDILELYVTFGSAMFTPVSWKQPIRKLLVAKYDAQPLSDMLQRIFSEDGEGKVPALLSSNLLRKKLLVVVRNLTTGSAWPLTNNPDAIFNDPKAPNCNMNVPLWKIVRASTAAPSYFEPEEITLGDDTFLFVDGAITPYNNPSLIAALTAVLPCYKMNWETGPDKLRLISVGTMRFSTQLPVEAQKLWLGYYAAKIPGSLMEGVAWEQDYMCRCLGKCLYGEPLDSEIGDLTGTPINAAHPGPSWFSYVRYNKSYKAEALREVLLKNPKLARLDALDAMPLLRQAGKEYAEECVRLEHLV